MGYLITAVAEILMPRVNYITKLGFSLQLLYPVVKTQF